MADILDLYTRLTCTRGYTEHITYIKLHVHIIRLVNNNHLQLVFTSAQAQVINEWKVLKHKLVQHTSSHTEPFGA